MSARFVIAVQLAEPVGIGFTRKDLPNLAQAIQAITAAARAQWMAYAGGAPLPDGTTIGTRSGRYLKSIQQRDLGDFETEVFSDSPYAKGIEDGIPARDLKKMLDTSMKVRVSKDGKRYLIIPFRWGTPGAVGMGRNVMPEAVHAMAMTMTPSRVTAQGDRVSGTGAWDVKTRAPFKVAQRAYLWGDRLKKEQLAEAGVFGQAARRMAGMVRFQNAAGGKGGAKHTQYLTFRVMSENSRGWLVPAIPGRHPARAVADQFRPIAEQAFQRALAADVRAILGGSQ